MCVSKSLGPTCHQETINIRHRVMLPDLKITFLTIKYGYHFKITFRTFPTHKEFSMYVE